ncbi:MAG: beta-lactamase family protein [Chloroflexi bacterium]|nr:beta-lactamase family protein [Chloroflexota bacterium]
MATANERVRTVLEELTGSGRELGVQVAAFLDGECVIDAWAGLADRESGRPVTGETLFTAMSIGKAVAATCLHLLADRGQLDYDAPIARYWPEFAARGKERATVRHALTHATAVPQLPSGTTPELLCDWDAMCAGIASLEPLWEPGTKTGYHALTFGWIVGELVRRVDGRPLNDLLQEEICRPLRISGLYFGAPDGSSEQIATRADAPVAPPAATAATAPSDPLYERAFPLALAAAPVWNRQDVREASIPGAGGITNARSLARLFAALAQGGEIDGVRLLRPEVVRVATALQTDAFDEVLGPRPDLAAPVRKALGYQLGGPRTPATTYHSAMGLRTTAFGHGGAGGMIAFADPEQRLAFAYLKNLATPSRPGVPDSALAVAQTVRSALGLGE